MAVIPLSLWLAFNMSPQPNKTMPTVAVSCTGESQPGPHLPSGNYLLWYASNKVGRQNTWRRFGPLHLPSGSICLVTISRDAEISVARNPANLQKFYDPPAGEFCWLWFLAEKVAGRMEFIVRLERLASIQQTEPSSTRKEPKKKSLSTQLLFDNSNDEPGEGDPPLATAFTLTSPHYITLIQTYHRQETETPAKPEIFLERNDHRQYGPWPAVLYVNHAAPQIYCWACKPEMILPAGTYRITAPEESSWLNNAKSEQCGMAHVEGYPVKVADEL